MFLLTSTIKHFTIVCTLKKYSEAMTDRGKEEMAQVQIHIILKISCLWIDYHFISPDPSNLKVCVIIKTFGLQGIRLLSLY